eukprot:gene32555-biopygen9518
MSLPPESPPPPPSPHREHETLIQYNLRNKRGAAPAEASGGGCVAAAAGGGGAPTVVIDEEDEIENPCPVCLDTEDDAAVDGRSAGMCSACGQSYCGVCNMGGLANRSPNCPTCRAPLIVSDEKNFTRGWKLVHDRSPGRHTPAVQCSLGATYSIGKGVEQDHVEAVKWFRKASEAGFAKAQFNLGIMYGKGEGVEQDHVMAAKWYRKSAEAGNAHAQCMLGNMYDNGNGVEQDHVEAAKWYRKAAAAGDAHAQYNLGVMYCKGEGVEQDHVEAAKWFRKAAEAGDAAAQHNLGAMYGNGQGVEQDNSNSVKWFQLAAAQGFKDALTALDHMQQHHVIPTPPLGTAVTTILLTSANAAKYNNRTGRVVAPTEVAAIKAGRAAVLLDGEAAPISFKLNNLQLHP